MRPRIENERIYQAAIPCFARYGYKKTTLEDIAGALDMSTANLYSYTDSKRSLYEECVAYAIDQWQETVRQATAAIEDPREKLLVTLRTGASYLFTHNDTMALLKNDPTIFPMFPTVDPIEEYNDWAEGFCRDILQDGVDKGVFREMDVNVMASLLFGFYKFIVISSVEEEPDPETMKKIMEATGTLIFDGLCIE